LSKINKKEAEKRKNHKKSKQKKELKEFCKGLKVCFAKYNFYFKLNCSAE